MDRRQAQVGPGAVARGQAVVAEAVELVAQAGLGLQHVREHVRLQRVEDEDQHVPVPRPLQDGRDGIRARATHRPPRGGGGAQRLHERAAHQHRQQRGHHARLPRPQPGEERPPRQGDEQPGRPRGEVRGQARPVEVHRRTGKEPGPDPRVRGEADQGRAGVPPEPRGEARDDQRQQDEEQKARGEHREQQVARSAHEILGAGAVQLDRDADERRRGEQGRGEQGVGGAGAHLSPGRVARGHGRRSYRKMTRPAAETARLSTIRAFAASNCRKFSSV